MAVYIPFGFCQATINFTGPTRSGKAATVLGFDTGTTSDLAEVAQAIFSAWSAHMSLVQHEAFTVTDVRCIDIASFGVSTGSPQEGNRTGDLAPPQVSMLVNKNSVERGRSKRGRSYLPGFLNDGDVYDDGTINPTWVDSVTTQLIDFRDTLTAAGVGDLVILHNEEVAPTYVASYAINNRVATQRRRLR